MACNLHAFSKGRLLLGLGAGWYEQEYLAKGYPFPNLQVRHEQLVEAIKIIRPLIDGKRVEFHGQHYTANTVSYPYRKSRIHLILGGWSPTVRRLVAEFADEWNLWNGNPANFKEIKQQMSKTGRRIEISRAGPFFIAKTQSQLKRKVKASSDLLTELKLPTNIDELQKHGVPCGTADEIRSQLNQLEKAGVDRFYFDILDPKDTEMVDLLSHAMR
jgi:alkanesulfonate monooxygenase SsuD/methylene tetrahydromethanopterin reductase-like flavin-dependent oxidoreductase (luciferase family)